MARKPPRSETPLEAAKRRAVTGLAGVFESDGAPPLILSDAAFVRKAQAYVTREIMRACGWSRDEIVACLLALHFPNSDARKPDNDAEKVQRGSLSAESTKMGDVILSWLRADDTRLAAQIADIRERCPEIGTKNPGIRTAFARDRRAPNALVLEQATTNSTSR